MRLIGHCARRGAAVDDRLALLNPRCTRALRQRRLGELWNELQRVCHGVIEREKFTTATGYGAWGCSVVKDGSWAILGIERGDVDERAHAVLESPAIEPLPRRMPTNYLPELKPWPVAAPDSSLSLLFPTRPRLNIKLPPRSSWVWSPLEWWAVTPGLPSGSWTWQPGWQPVLRETIRLASTTLAASMPGARLPSWVQDTSRSVIPESVPPWPRVRAPDFHIPTGRSRFAGENNLEPPAQFVRWVDRIETVLPIGEVNRRCQAIGAKHPPPGGFLRGCAHGTAGRCFIIRIDDPGIARHEFAHCNGWQHPLP